MIHPVSTDPAPDVDLDRVRRIHLMGIGGTGMGAFAGLLKKAGYEVTGSDEAIYPPMSEMLAALGHSGDARATGPRTWRSPSRTWCPIWWSSATSSAA